MQSLCEEELALLGRTHTVPEALHFVDEAGRLFPGNTSVDLLYGRPRQQPQQWLSELNKVSLPQKCKVLMIVLSSVGVPYAVLP